MSGRPQPWFDRLTMSGRPQPWFDRLTMSGGNHGEW